jgi:hypothetical protein
VGVQSFHNSTVSRATYKTVRALSLVNQLSYLFCPRWIIGDQFFLECFLSNEAPIENADLVVLFSDPGFEVEGSCHCTAKEIGQTIR